VRDLFLAFLAQHDDDAWLRVIERLEPSMHPVDRAATHVWFQLYPLALQRAMARADSVDLARRMTLAGRWRLEEQIASSHRFLFGHRYWAQTVAATLDYAGGSPGSLDLGAQIQEVARQVARHARCDTALVVGITAVAIRTLQQVGFEAFSGASREVRLGTLRSKSADRIIKARQGQPSKGLFGLLRSQSSARVTFDERDEAASFPLIPSQHLTTAAALDRRDFRAVDPRCSEGPIPVQCRSCSCGTCWVGVLSDASALSTMDDDERSKLAEIGVRGEGSHPPIRLSCMTQAYGNVSIVIPPWNGLVARIIRTLAPEK
jgi:ferredoxin